MGRDGDQANVTLGAGLLLMVLADDAKTSKLTLSTRVGLEGDVVHTSQSDELMADHTQELLPARELINGLIGVDSAALGVGDQLHLAGGVELHGAGTKRNHRVNQRQILGLEMVHVSKNLCLAVVGVEHLMGEVIGGSADIFGERGDDFIFRELGLSCPVAGGDIDVTFALVLGSDFGQGIGDSEADVRTSLGGDGESDLAMLRKVSSTNTLI